jgi:shikimate dehydrogenase
MNEYGLTGYPLEHSFSRNYFAAKFKKENLSDCIFSNFPTEDINSLSIIIDSHPRLKGLAVTIPHKKSIIPLLDELSEEAAAVGAVNCIRIRDRKLSGFNTDIIGFEESFKKHLNQDHRKALVLGSGGSSLAVKYVLNKLGIESQTVSRSGSVNRSISYESLTEEVFAAHRIIINCTPVGMHPETGKCPHIPYEFISSGHYLFDLIYNPEETLFLKKGRERGALVKNGMEMLEIQAEANWQLWND